MQNRKIKLRDFADDSALGSAEVRQMESTLRQTKQTLATLISNLPGFVYRCHNDPGWTMIYVSDGCLEVTGYTPEDLVQNQKVSYGSLIHPSDRNWEAWQGWLSAEESLESEYRITHANGEQRWVWERGRGVFSDDGVLMYLEGFITDITNRKEAEVRLATQEEQYRLLFEFSPVPIAIMDLAGNFLQVNAAYEQGMLYDRQELEGKNVRICVLPENYSTMEEHLVALRGGETLEHEAVCVRKGGERRINILREKAIPLPGGQEGIISLSRDITEVKLAQGALVQSEKKYRSLVETMREGMFIIDFTGKIRFWNQAGLSMFGLDPTDLDELLSGTALDYIHSASMAIVQRDMALVMKGHNLTGEYRYLRHSGESGWLEANATKMDYSNEPAILVLARDITERKKEQAEMEFLSWHDPLTGVYNRRYFESRLSDKALAKPGIVVVDLDGLKLVNDTIGHTAGDSLLKEAAGILKRCTPSGGMAARIGGDEFVIILSDSTQAQAEAVVGAIRRLQEEYNRQQPQFPLSLSLGYEVAGDETTSLYEIFKRADNLMYRQKLLHRLSSRSAIVQALMAALEAKNVETREHVDRIGELALLVARRMGYPEGRILELELFAKFHDIGKVGVADSILNKPGRLTDEERKEIERHAEIGYHIASSTPELAPIARFILKHQEWYDGNGYPLGLKGADIPVECRIVAIADAFDAMTSDRPYRKAMSTDQALAELDRCAGTQFDPELVLVFRSII
ncbi:MAG: PAS domain S-box protein [Peptococcaceae bacterium]|nr:PAS domain S-box protein [Peptococcaceae bacterium]